MYMHQHLHNESANKLKMNVLLPPLPLSQQRLINPILQNVAQD